MLLACGAWQEVRGRAEQWLKWRTKGDPLLDHSLEYLTLGRAAVQEALAQAGLPAVSGLAPDLACVQAYGGAVEAYRREVQALSGMVEPISGMVQPISGMVEAYRRAVEWLNQAVDGLREAGAEHHLPRGLLARAAWGRWAGVLLAQPAHWATAEKDLRECEDIAQRGGMLLHLIDCHLEAARLALAADRPVLARTAAAHVAAAEARIATTGYKRRRGEAEEIAAAVK